ncbi:aminopeptidase C [Odoribacter laneus]|uniref:aminopeptidase C n=1 Tax=Odoribacter laneus TaxID=626933 RepID=UPI0003361D20|nr:C1 family peptidase [Odoribacter laneus]CCZ82068.1 putative uncharacterized protein [Odoribacter laneus CAG:561]
MGKNITLIGICACAFLCQVQAQEQKTEGYQFTELKRMPATDVKSQDRSSTCWAWSGLSFFESEIARLGKDTVSLSPMYIVWHTYNEKADRYVRLHGEMNFSPGGAHYDVQWGIDRYGIVPLDVYTGLNYGEKVHAHAELNSLLRAYADIIVKNPNRKITTAWKDGYQGILRAYLGELPQTFTYKGKEYTPLSFAQMLGLNMADYIQLTSFSHHPYYTSFAIEVPDNWLNGNTYNLPLDEFIAVLDKAVDKGFTFAWAADLSEKGFTNGIAVVPTFDTKEMKDAEITKWVSLPQEDRQRQFIQQPCSEKKITQEMRQQAFDNYQTTDDHGMHIVGKAKDQNGTPYFIVKNSWGKYNKYDGYLYASYPYVAYKTISVMIHKDALSKELKRKLGIE